MQKHLLILSFLTTSLFAACSSETKESNTVGTPRSAQLSVAFRSNCGGCHNPDGSGDFGPKIKGFRGDMSTFESIVRSGTGAMPAVDASIYSKATLESDFSALSR